MQLRCNEMSMKEFVAIELVDVTKKTPIRNERAQYIYTHLVFLFFSNYVRGIRQMDHHLNGC